MLRAVLFDIDGTLVDTVELHARAWQEAFARFGKPLAYEEVHLQIGKGGDQLIPTFLDADEQERFGEDLEAFRSDLYAREYLHLARPLPGARELVARVRADGLRTAIASSCKRAELDHYLDLAGIEHLIDVAITGDDIDASKPEPDVFETALGRLAVEPAEAIAVGDSPWDVLGAARAGVRTIGLLSGGFPARALLDAGCIALYDDPADLLARHAGSPLAFREPPHAGA